MDRPITFKLIMHTVKEYLLFFIVVAITVAASFHFAYQGLASYKTYEVLNFAITSYSYQSTTGEAFAKSLAKNLKNEGIEKVDLFYTEYNNKDNPLEWFEDIGLLNNDLYIVDDELSNSLTYQSSLYFTSNDLEELNSSVSFELKYVENQLGKYGVVIYDADDTSYNSNFKFADSSYWLNFTSNEKQHDFIISINDTTEINRETKLKALIYFLNENKS